MRLKLSFFLLTGMFAAALPSTTLGQEAKGGPTWVQHEPVNQSNGTRTVLRFEVEHPEHLGRLLVHVQGAKSKEVETIEARYDGEEYVVVLASDVIARPYFRYWAERVVDGDRIPVFASAEEPHWVSVPVSRVEEYEQATLERTGGRRSTLRLDGEYVGFASDASDKSLFYGHAEAGYRYAFLTWVDNIEFRIGTLRSNIPSSEPVLEGEEADNIGFDYGGASAQFRVHEYLRVRTGILFGISEAGFEYGGLGELTLGEPHRTTLSVGIEGTRTRGLTSHARLAWNTVRNVPMSATIEVTNFPNGEALGVRLRYDIGYRFSQAFGVRVGLGYRGQHAQQGGLVGALGLDVSF